MSGVVGGTTNHSNFSKEIENTVQISAFCFNELLLVKLLFYTGECVALLLLLENELGDTRNIDPLLTSSGICSPSFTRFHNNLPVGEN